MPAELARDIRASFGTITSLDYFALTFRRLPTLANKFRQLRETGVTMLVGTDSGIPGNFHTDSTWRELVKFVELGMTPMAAILSATRWPGRFLGKEHELGTLEPGALADVIAVRGDVLAEIGLLKEVDVVVKGGKRYK
jgi:imidazolonepropionase-like amidohydrolase